MKTPVIITTIVIIAAAVLIWLVSAYGNFGATRIPVQQTLDAQQPNQCLTACTQSCQDFQGQDRQSCLDSCEGFCS